MIVKNEEHNIFALMDDVCPVLEEVIVVDTGSTDRTLEILAEKQEKYPNLRIEHFEWIDDFSAARNYSFSLATQDWVFWVDGDDRINTQNLLHFKQNLLDDPNVDVWILPYIYSKNLDGSSALTLGRERFLRRGKKVIWQGAIHESIGIWHLRQKEYDGLAIEHNRVGKNIDFGRNLRILEREYERDPNNARTAYYTAKERFDSMKPNSKEALLHYLTLQGRFYDDEIGARFRLAKIYLSEENYGEAIKVIEPVYHLDGTRRRSEYYFIFGEVEYNLRNYEVAIEWYERCAKTPPPPPRVLNLEYWTWHPLKKIAMCYDHLGNWDRAAKYARKAMEKVVGDPEMVKWTESLSRKVLPPKQGHKLVTVEFGSQVRFDSYRLAEDFHNYDPHNLPFADESLDGVVDFMNSNRTEIQRILKPGGFLWTNYDFVCDGTDIQYVTTAEYLDQKHQIRSHIKADRTKPMIAYAYGDQHSGPYRYRIGNLITSAKKNGHKVLCTDDIAPDVAYVYVSMNLQNTVKNHNSIYVLEICEALPNNQNYHGYGIEKADIVNASSRALADHIRKIHPATTVINVDDHFELPAKGWL